MVVAVPEMRMPGEDSGWEVGRRDMGRCPEGAEVYVTVTGLLLG